MQSSSDRPNNIQQEDTRMEGKGNSMRKEINFLGLKAGKGARTHCICEVVGKENGFHLADCLPRTAVGTHEDKPN